jgi:hypothetical protein
LALQDPGDGLGPALTDVSKLEIKAPKRGEPSIRRFVEFYTAAWGTRLSSRDRGGQLDPNEQNPGRLRRTTEEKWP